MRKTTIFGISITILFASPAFAESPFDGRWKIDLSSIKRSPRPEIITIRKGLFTCASCEPHFTVPADGAFHVVNGQDDFDETAVRIVDAGTMIRTNRFKRRIVRVEMRTLSANRTTAVMSFTDTINPGVAPVKGRQILVRTAKAPPGAHALSGTWQHQIATDVSDNA